MDRIVYNTGFGIIPKSLMQNPNLSIEAKGIFCYLTTYANTDMQGFDHQQKIDAFITGLRNFGLCVLCYILILFSKKDYKK